MPAADRSGRPKSVGEAVRRYWPVALLLVGLVPPLVFSSWYTFDTQRSTLEHAYALELEQISSVVAEGMREPIWNLAPELGQPVIDSVMDDPRLVAIRVTSLAEGDFLQARRPAPPTGAPMVLTRPVVREGALIGRVHIEIDRDVIAARLDAPWLEIYALGALQLTLALSVVGFAMHALRRRERERALSQMNERLRREVEARARELEDAHRELLRKESLAVLGRLTATVSHELRNPLGTIGTALLTIERLLEEDEPERRRALMRRTLDRAERSIARCARIIDDLLGFARADTLQREPTDIDEWLAETVEECDIPASVTVEYLLDGGATVPIARERLRQAVTNLITNATQAMSVDSGAAPRGVLRVETRVCADEVEIRIGDTGPGVPADLRETIFEPLFSTKSFGFGLGLPLVRRVAEQHGGSVSLDGAGTAGATFVIRLPSNAAETGADG